MSADDRYRLGPLRDVRARDEGVRRGDLAVAVGDATTRAAAVVAAAGVVEVARAAVTAAVAAAAPTSEASRLALGDRYRVRRRRELAAAQDAHARAVAARDAQASEVDAARTRLASARAERKLIERHFERWREARRKAADRKED